ncbi:MAG: hypothetical protein ACJ8J0_23615 [Longimicrobiaceae bacterium]
MQLRAFPLAIAAATLASVAAVPAAAQRGCTIPRGQRVVVIGSEPLEISPGQSRVLPIGTSEAPYVPLTPLPAGCRPRWSVSKVSRATIDANGRLQVSRYARIGDRIVVTADVAGQSVFQEVHVIDPRPNPIAGSWAQDGAPRCTGRAPAEPVLELMIRRDNRFSVTFTPFETYKDYWGEYTYDRNSGALDMHVAGGNRVPPGIDLAGNARVVSGRLVLRDVWLGQPEPGAPRTCTYTFKR